MNPTRHITVSYEFLVWRVSSIVSLLSPFAVPAAICALVFGPSSINAADQETYIWRVSDEDSRFYLLGSIHLLRSSDYPLAEIYDIALEQVESVTFEINFDEVNEEVLAGFMADRATYTGSRRLRNDISVATYNKLQAYLQARGLAIIDDFKPWFYVILLSGIETEEEGLDQANGVDEHYFHLARQRSLQINALETPNQQLDLLMGLLESRSVSEIEEALNEVLDNPGLYAAEAFELIDAWNSGDLGQMESVLDQGAGSVEFDEKLLDERNLNWMPTLIDYLNTNRKAMVIVGAGHLIGPKGLLQLLKNEGYELEALPLPAWLEMDHNFSQERFGFTVKGNMGKRCFIQRSSDLDTWSGVISFELTDEAFFWQTDALPDTSQFYRAVLVGDN